jgi:hypothetical protein
MRKLLRRSWLWGPLLLAAVVGAGYLVVPVGEKQISQATCDTIQIGWSEEKVDELLPSSRANYFAFVPSVGEIGLGRYWEDDDDNVIVLWYRHARVSEKEFRPTTLSFIELAKRRVERRIKALWVKAQRPGS